MEQIRSFKFRLYPTNVQKGIIDNHLGICKNLYNELLEIKIETYNQSHISLSRFDISKCVTFLRAERNDYKQVERHVEDNICNRIDKAFKNMFRRIKKGEKAGFPRFKGKNRYKSFTYSQQGYKFLNDKKLKISKIGEIKIKKHRNFDKVIKIYNLTIQKTGTGKYYTNFCCLIDVELLPINENSIGIDVGLNHFLTTDKGVKIEHPKYFRKSEEKLVKLQRSFSKKKKSSKNRIKSKNRVALLHEKIANQRMDFIHKLSCDIVENYGLIAIENLNIKNMVKNHNFSKSINDSGWSLFATQLHYKVENTGGVVYKSDKFFPSSQLCSACGNRQDMPLHKRIYNYNTCGYIEDRDTNAAKNLLNNALKNTVGTMGINACEDGGLLPSMKQEAV